MMSSWCLFLDTHTTEYRCLIKMITKLGPLTLYLITLDIVDLKGQEHHTGWRVKSEYTWLTMLACPPMPECKCRFLPGNRESRSDFSFSFKSISSATLLLIAPILVAFFFDDPFEEEQISKPMSNTSTAPSPRATATNFPASPGISPSTTARAWTNGGLQMRPTPSLLELAVEAANKK